MRSPTLTFAIADLTDHTYFLLLPHHFEQLQTEVLITTQASSLIRPPNSLLHLNAHQRTDSGTPTFQQLALQQPLGSATHLDNQIVSSCPIQLHFSYFR